MERASVWVWGCCSRPNKIRPLVAVALTFEVKGQAFVV